MNDVIDFEKVRQQQVASKKPEIWCVISCKYEDTTLVATVHACFFSEDEAGKARDWMQKEMPIAQSVGWYEIEQTKLSVMA